MAYIYNNGEKYFPILDFYSYDWLNLRENTNALFEVDELMALPIACLNNKGYITDGCCSGHTVGDLFCELADEDVEQFREEGSLIAVQHLEEDDAEYMCWVGIPNPGAYISFKNRIRFQTIPNGWNYDYRYARLSCDVPSSENPMTYYKKISVALESLMDWIMRLPPNGR